MICECWLVWGGNLVDQVRVHVVICTVGVLASWYRRVTENCNLATLGCI